MDARRADLLVELLTGRRCAATGGCPSQDCDSDGDCDCASPPTDCASPPTGVVPTRGTGAGPGKPLVSVIVPITTLLGLDQHPGELVPIPASLAREIAAAGPGGGC